MMLAHRLLSPEAHDYDKIPDLGAARLVGDDEGGRGV